MKELKIVEELKREENPFNVEKWLDDVYGFDADDAYTSEEVFNLAEMLAKDVATIAREEADKVIDAGMSRIDVMEEQAYQKGRKGREEAEQKLEIATQALSDIENNVITEGEEGWRDACLEKITIAYDALNKIYPDES